MRGVYIENEGYRCSLALLVLCWVYYGYFGTGRNELSHHVVVVQKGEPKLCGAIGTARQLTLEQIHMFDSMAITLSDV